MKETDALSRVVAELEAEAGEEDEWLPFHGDRHAQLVLASEACRAVVFVTKFGVFERLFADFGVPDDVSVFSCVGFPSRAVRRMIQDEAARSVENEVRFVGDLDPLDLTIFMTLRDGAAAPEVGPRVGIKARWVGAGDPWLAAWRHEIGSSIRPADQDTLTLRMRPFERKNFDVLNALGGDLPSLVGPESHALLLGGKKLEVDAFLGTSVSSSALRAEIWKLVFGK